MGLCRQDIVGGPRGGHTKGSADVITGLEIDSTRNESAVGQILVSLCIVARSACCCCCCCCCCLVEVVLEGIDEHEN